MNGAKSRRYRNVKVKKREDQDNGRSMADQCDSQHRQAARREIRPPPKAIKTDGGKENG
jgi:hypothetical protein